MMTQKKPTGPAKYLQSFKVGQIQSKSCVLVDAVRGRLLHTFFSKKSIYIDLAERTLDFRTESRSDFRILTERKLLCSIKDN